MTKGTDFYNENIMTFIGMKCHEMYYQGMIETRSEVVGFVVNCVMSIMNTVAGCDVKNDDEFFEWAVHLADKIPDHFINPVAMESFQKLSTSAGDFRRELLACRNTVLFSQKNLYQPKQKTSCLC